MLKATRVDGVYSADPETNKDAVFYNSLSFDEAIQQNLKIMDATALTLARDHSLPIKVFDFSKKNALLDIACGKSIGTLISS
jgi:uridylate kinase